MVGRETQDFASLLGIRHWVNDGGLKDNVAACKSRDAIFCVSQGRNAFVVSDVIACGCWYGQDGRRKILRLYKAGAIIVLV